MALTTQFYRERTVLGQGLKPSFFGGKPFAKDVSRLRGKQNPKDPFVKNWDRLAAESNPARFAKDLLQLALAIESENPSQAPALFQYLIEKKGLPAAIQHQAARHLALWKGQGSFAERSAHWLRFLPQEVMRGETAAGLLLGLGGFKVGLKLGRAAFGAVPSWQGFLGVGAMALVSEASATALGYGIIQNLRGEKADIAGLWANSFALSSTYRGLGFLFSRAVHLPLPLSFSQTLSQGWRSLSPMTKQELGKFTGILAVETLLPYSPLNLGGLSTARDPWFNSLTTYINLSLHHGFARSAFPGWMKTTLPATSEIKLPIAPWFKVKHLAYSLALAENRALPKKHSVRLPGDEYSVGEMASQRPLKQTMEIGSGSPSMEASPPRAPARRRPRGKPPVNPQPAPLTHLKILKRKLLESDSIQLFFSREPSPQALLWFCERLETVARHLRLQNKSISVELIIPNGRNILLIKGMDKEDFTTVSPVLFKDLNILSGQLPKSELIQLNLPRRPSPQELLWFCKRLETMARESGLKDKNRLVQLVLPDKKVILLRKGKDKENFEEVVPYVNPNIELKYGSD